MASYRLSDRALADLDRLYEHGIHNFGLRQADEYYDGLIARVQTILDSPLQWRRVDAVGEGLRRNDGRGKIPLPKGHTGDWRSAAGVASTGQKWKLKEYIAVPDPPYAKAVFWESHRGWHATDIYTPP